MDDKQTEIPRYRREIAAVPLLTTYDNLARARPIVVRVVSTCCAQHGRIRRKKRRAPNNPEYSTPVAVGGVVSSRNDGRDPLCAATPPPPRLKPLNNHRR